MKERLFIAPVDEVVDDVIKNVTLMMKNAERELLSAIMSSGETTKITCK